MAPVRQTAVGVAPQSIDDPEIIALLEDLKSVQVKNENEDIFEGGIDRLVAILDRHQTWTSEEQVDLYHWIEVLSKIDFVLSYLIQSYPGLLLVAPVERKEKQSTTANTTERKFASSVEETEAVPERVVASVVSILNFLSSLLRNSANKVVFNSVEELADLLAAADDTIAKLALKCLANVASPPSLHKQQAPEGHQHTSALHSSKTTSHHRLLALARGWGSRGSGLGLYACVTADDSDHGQGILPPEGGEVHFQFFRNSKKKTDEPADEKKDEDVNANEMISVHLTADQIKHSSPTKGSFAEATNTAPLVAVKSVAEIFFKCCALAGGRDRIPEEGLFQLLTDVRLARGFHSSELRVAAVESRLLALITTLYAHSSQEVMSGYFQAQPELLVELADLLRPTVSSSTVSSASAFPSDGKRGAGRLQTISGLADPKEIPYSLRNLAVEALTALVARRDGSNGGLTGVGRQANVLIELGVGKGLYLGLLPTLVRYSLASLSSFLSEDPQSTNDTVKVEQSEEEAIAMSLGLGFVEATRAPQLATGEHVMRALEFVDSVLTLTSAVVSAPSGTAALTECGLIPSLLSTVSIGAIDDLPPLSPTIKSSLTPKDLGRIRAQLRFIASQAIQIVEGAVVTHNAALSAFHDLSGVPVLISRLHLEIEAVKTLSSSGTEPSPMEVEGGESQTQKRELVSSRRVLLFSIVNCLTVVFHQESTSSSTTMSSGGAQLRKPELTESIIEVMKNISSYGGVLAALTASLLSDVMNSDPHVVYHVHKSGIAAAFFDMLAADEDHSIHGPEPLLPPVAELIMALPNVIAALALTADGAAQVKERNPFPSLLRILYHPKYAMPRSRCLQNELTAIVGTGLDEIMRHVPSLHSMVIDAIVGGMKQTVEIGRGLVAREATVVDEAARKDLENERTCLMLYALNFGQMLEQILHSQDHCEPFVQAGGLYAILDLFPYLLSPGSQFIASASCQSCPSVSTLAHSTTEDSLTVAFRCIAISYDSQKMLQLLRKRVEDGLEATQSALLTARNVFGADRVSAGDENELYGFLEALPRKHLHTLKREEGFTEKIDALSRFFRSIVNLQWQTNLLATVIRAACKKSQEGGSGWGRVEREWKKELSSEWFETLASKLSVFHQSSILEACRYRASDEYESLYRRRMRQEDENATVHYRLRIVCQEGAVVRDGIEIDSCTNVGGMEMGEIVDAFDRCVNSSGVMRYRTARGWISELTRGHGREPIAEVIDTYISQSSVERSEGEKTKRIEFGAATVASVGASILARLQSSYRDLFVAIGRTLVQGIRSIPVRAMSYQQGTVGDHVRSLLNVMTSSILGCFNKKPVKCVLQGSEMNDFAPLTKAGAAIYLGTMIGHLHSCLFEDKRERKMVNVALLLSHLTSDTDLLGLLENTDESKAADDTELSLFTAVEFILSHALEDASARNEIGGIADGEESRRTSPGVARTVAASLPPAIFLLRRLLSGTLLKSTPVSTTLNRLSNSDLVQLVGSSPTNPLMILLCQDGDDSKFSPAMFVKFLHLKVAKCVLRVWQDSRISSLPSHIIYPMTALVSDIVAGMEDSLKNKANAEEENQGNNRGWPGGLFGRLYAGPGASAARNRGGGTGGREEIFEPNEDVVSRLMEMGFTRDHALDAIETTESNRVEVAMEYALSHQPASPATLERRRARREARREELRRRLRSDQAEGGESDTGNNTNNGTNDQQETNVSDESESNGLIEPSEPMDVEKDTKPEEETKESIERKTNKLLDSELQRWIEATPRMSIQLLISSQLSSHSLQESRAFDGNGEAEATTTVVSSFLLGFCQRYSDKSESTVLAILTRLREAFKEEKKDNVTVFLVADEEEGQVASLCHASVIFMRALPRLRSLVLKLGLVTSITSAIERVCESRLKDQIPAWPSWLAPAFLLLDVMSQPMIFPSTDMEEGKGKGDGSNSSIDSEEFVRVKKEHETQAQSTARTADLLWEKASEISSIGLSTQDESGSKETTDKAIQDGDQKPDRKSPFADVPAFYPLIPSEAMELAVQACLRVLAVRREDENGVQHATPPGIAHAALLLLSRTLRSTKVAAASLRRGTAELILGLPRKCRFHGCTGLVAIIMKRLLEDETNLQTTMETEIRSILMKLHKKKGQTFQGDKPVVSRQVFLRAVTPLLCRDPVLFMRAAFTTIAFDLEEKRSKDGTVALLSPEESALKVKVLNEIKGAADRKGRPQSTTKTLKSKQTQRSSVSRRGSVSRKARRDSITGKKDGVLNGTPANHILSLLIVKVMELWSTGDSSFGENVSFLWIGDIIEIMADLVLAVPACAAAIHRFKGPVSKDKTSLLQPLLNLKHTLSNSPKPSRTVVSFLLHAVLPQDRWNYRQDHTAWERLVNDGERNERKAAFLKTRVAQTTARLLVALVARPGEGRRRVLAELAFALSSGTLGTSSAVDRSLGDVHVVQSAKVESELCALQSWGDLCMGLAAPRSNGQNHDNNSSLSYEVVRSMLDFKMAHALVSGVKRVTLKHPMAPSTCAALLVPLEVFTRPSVTEAIQTMVEKETTDREKAKEEGGKQSQKKKDGTLSRNLSIGPSQRSESAFADDAMIEDGFDADTAVRNQGSQVSAVAADFGFAAETSEDEDMEVDVGVDDEQEEQDDGMELDGEDENDDDDEDEDEDDEDADSDEASQESEILPGGDDDSEIDSVDEDEDQSESSDDEHELFEEEAADEGWNQGDGNDFFEPDEEEERGENIIQAQQEPDLEDWDRIESPSLGGMIFGGRRLGRAPNFSSRARGLVDAAEAMIGTLLRTGEIQGEALAEIEGTLGIRIMPSQQSQPDFGSEERGSIWNQTSRTENQDRSRVGNLPSVSQRSPPEVGYSVPGGGGRWSDISAMEMVYGGPSLVAGSRNYDVVPDTSTVDDDGNYPLLSAVDGQLFPGGPASATHSRAPQAVHALLAGVDLPPLNSLVSDLLPHGRRSSRFPSANPRRGSDSPWSSGFAFSGFGGSNVRPSRYSDQTQGSGVMGWSDDIQLDGSIGEFSTAFERALVSAIRTQRDRHDSASTLQGQTIEGQSVASSDRMQDDTEENVDSSQAESNTEDRSNHQPPVSQQSNAEGDTVAHPETSEDQAQNVDRESTTTDDRGRDGDVDGEATDGEATGVASSLASALRLSSDGSETNTEGNRGAGSAAGLGNQSSVAVDRSDSSHPNENVAEEEEEDDEEEENEDPHDASEQETMQSEIQGSEENIDMHRDEAAESGGASTRDDAEPTEEGSAVDRGSDGAIDRGDGVLVCPAGMDLDVFNSLPPDMQREVVEQHQTAVEVAAQIDESSGLDPEALAALPEDMRREILEQQQRERQLREQPPADPSNAEEMDNASFVASLAPDLRREILSTADETFLNSLPPEIRAEAQILRERASIQRRTDPIPQPDETIREEPTGIRTGSGTSGGSSRRRVKTGKVKVDHERDMVVFHPNADAPTIEPFSTQSLKALLRLMFLLSPVRPQRLLQKVLHNLTFVSCLRCGISGAFTRLLNNDGDGAAAALESVEAQETTMGKVSSDDFPPSELIGAPPEVFHTEELGQSFFRRRQTSNCAASIAANLPPSAKGSSRPEIPGVVSTRIVETLAYLCKNSSRFCVDALTSPILETHGEGADQYTCFEQLLELLQLPRVANSATNLDQLLAMLELMVSPLSALARDPEEESEVAQKELEAAAASGKEWIDVPRVVVSPSKLQALCSTLKLETCRDSSFNKINTITRRLCRIEANRDHILTELAAVAQSLGEDAIRDLRVLSVRLGEAVQLNHRPQQDTSDGDDSRPNKSASASVTLSTSSSELKLLRVLQTLHSLCTASQVEDGSAKKHETFATSELIQILDSIRLDELWQELSGCLKAVKVLEGISSFDELETDRGDGENDDTHSEGPAESGDEDNETREGKKLQNSAAGLLTRFLPVIEAFFVANASAVKTEDASKQEQKDGTRGTESSSAQDNQQHDVSSLVGGESFLGFVAENRVLLNALIRNNSSLLEKGLRAMVQVASCRSFLDFDVKRQWFKTQIRRLRQQASRRNGSLRLSIRRKHVFEDAYHQLRLRNADEMRSRLHITFRNEEGVDAGGLSREFFAILAKEMFNPNYALFTSTEDGCTFQPNQHSSINPDHLSYFRFVGRIVGKAVADGFLLDAHFTRSLYKHMLGLKPTHHDMEAIDPDYYKSLKTILEYSLTDIGLELTFSIEDFTFGRNQTVDLVPNGRNVPVTDENKAKYVSLVCQHRMTTAISSQIKAYLDGFYELVSRDLIAIFTPRELELLISGLPDIDVHDLKKNTDYVGWKATDDEIEWFWNVMSSLTRNQKASFLQFVTGSAKVPLAGFSELQGMRGVQKFSIHKAGGSSGALMSAHTCFNSLDLPEYESEDELREKLLYAISEGQGSFMFA